MQKIRSIEIGQNYAIQGEKVKAVMIRCLGAKFNHMQQITFEGNGKYYVANQWADGSIYRITKQ